VWFAGVGNLYSREFYELAREHLAPGGVMQQWVQLHHIAPEEALSVVATVRAVFPYVTLWALGAQGVIVGSMEPHDVIPDVVAALKASPALEEDIARLPEGALDDLASFRILDAAQTTRLLETIEKRGIPLNTDARRFLEYATPRHNLDRTDFKRLNREAFLEAAGAQPPAPPPAPPPP
jgi:spermidine synthase